MQPADSHACAEALPRHRYAEFALPALPQVEAFWAMRAHAAPHRVLPDGCIDFLFDLERAQATVVGTMTTSHVISLAADARFFGVRFAPGAALPFIHARAFELTDAQAPMNEVTSAHGFRLMERVVEAASHLERARIVAAFLNTARARIQPEDLRVRRAVRMLRERSGCVNIATLAQQLTLSPRQLERRFQQQVGASPKFIARTLRMQAALRLLERAPNYRGAYALAAGFADEPHLAREFRALTGLSPRQLVRERGVAIVQPEAFDLV
jgi:AraC-like DNA-binding protein